MKIAIMTRKVPISGGEKGQSEVKGAETAAGGNYLT